MKTEEKLKHIEHYVAARLDELERNYQHTIDADTKNIINERYNELVLLNDLLNELINS